MGTVYACVHIEKCVEKDSFEDGCDPSSRTCVMDENVNIESDTLPGLIKAIGDQYALEIDDVWFPTEQHDETEADDTRISFNRLETDDGDVPDADDTRQWKKGKLTLWLADYDFIIEKRGVSAVLIDEFKAAGIKTHD